MPDDSHETRKRVKLPEEGWSSAEIRTALAHYREEDIPWKRGRVAGLVYLAGDDVLEVAEQAYSDYFSTNGMSLRAFPSLEQIETQVVSMTGDLLNNPDGYGNITSGGTESIILGVKIARDRARALWPEITEPEMVLPFSAHPAFNKAAHYLGVKAVRTPLTEEFRVDLDAYEAAITPNTILMVGSAPNYPFGMVDPIPEMSALANERNLSFHVDACVGGFFLPFVEKLGRTLPAWDFRNPGVTTISADLHKFGYGAKGASTIICRDEEIYAYQGFEFGEWPSGFYRTPTITGTRAGAAMASAWAVLHYLGENGYKRLTQSTLEYIARLVDGINAIPELEVHGQPDMSLLAYGSSSIDIYAVADGLEERGWFVYRERFPKGIHLMLSPGHEPYIDQYLSDIEAATDDVRRNNLQGRNVEARYG